MASQQTMLSGAVSITGSPFPDASEVTTYGALLLPYDPKKFLEQNKPQINPKKMTSFKDKMQSAFGTSSNKETLKAAIKNPSRTFHTLSTYMTDNRDAIKGITSRAKGLANDIGSKFSGIAVAQALINGKVTSKEALDYLFMGFAPALGVQGSLMGYSGLNQMKEALFDGDINVGAFVSGFTRTLKGATDLKDMLSNKKGRIDSRIIEFDLTISHSESYQSETPDRRVQSGQSLNEFIHNMPETFEVQCALQDGKRYSKSEFRAIIEQVRDKKTTVQLVLGDELFDELILTNFSPNNDCSKSGMDYTLSFKKIHRCDIDTKTEVTISEAPKPEVMDEQMGVSSSQSASSASGTGSRRNSRNASGLGTSKGVSTPNISNEAVGVGQKMMKTVKKLQGGSLLFYGADLINILAGHGGL